MKKFLLLLLIVSPLLAEEPRKDWLAAFDDASPNAFLRVNYSSNGCFHGFEYQIDLTFDDHTNTATATVTEIIPHRERVWSELKFTRVKIGTVILKGRDMDRLSGLLRYYESFAPSKQISTTVDHVIFQKVEGDKTLALADIEDQTSSLQGRLDVLTFYEIVERLKPATDPDAVPPSNPK